MTQFDTERLCRLNGKSPTQRERWTAFYRLYRICQRADPRSDVVDCLRVIFRDWSFIRLADASGDNLANNNIVPKFLRRKFIEANRRIRLDEKQNAMMRKLIEAIYRDPNETVTT